jgi:hypothetical protein
MGYIFEIMVDLKSEVSRYWEVVDGGIDIFDDPESPNSFLKLSK